MSKFFRQLKRSLRQAADTEWRKQTGRRDWKYELFELRCSFMDTFFYSWFTSLVVFYENCERMVQWFPILWKDRNWDDSYILNILQHKIRFTREVVSEHGYYVDSRKYARQMKVAELLLERLQDSNKYVEKDWEDHFKLYPRRIYLNNSNEDISFPAQDDKQYSKNVRRMMDKEEYMWNQDFKYLCEYMRKHLRKWNN